MPEFQGQGDGCFSAEIIEGRHGKANNEETGAPVTRDARIGPVLAIN